MAYRQQHGGPILMAFLAGAAAATLAGGYYLFGPEGRRHHREASRWIATMKDEILERMENAKDMTEESYGKIVDEVSDRYASTRNLSMAQLEKLRERFKKRWSEMRQKAREAAIDAQLELEAEDL